LANLNQSVFVIFLRILYMITNPGKADLIADEHQAPGSSAGAHGWSRRGGQASKAAAAEVEAAVAATDAGGMASLFRGLSSSATFNTVTGTALLSAQVDRHASCRELLESH
jgi:hypothetical protein